MKIRSACIALLCMSGFMQRAAGAAFSIVPHATARDYMQEALVYALIGGSLEHIRATIVAGADSNKAYGELQETPLTLVARRGDRFKMRELRTYGAHINKPDGCGRSPLYAAVCNSDRNPFGNQYMVLELLQQSADSNQSGPGSNSPLLVATEKEDKDVMEILLMYDADPYAQNADGDSPMSIATRIARKKRDAIFLELLQAHIEHREELAQYGSDISSDE